MIRLDWPRPLIYLEQDAVYRGALDERGFCVMEMVPVRLPEAMTQALDRVADREGLDRLAALRRLLAAGLGR